MADNVLLEAESTGFVENLESDVVSGWYYSGEVFPEVSTIKVVDELGERLIKCDEYRADLDQLGVNHGYCGFSVRISGNFEIFSEKTGELVKKSEDYSVTEVGNSKKVVEENLLSKIHYVVSKNDPRTKKLAIISSFLADPSFYSYQGEIIKFLKENGFYTVYVLPENMVSPHGKQLNSAVYSDADVVIIRENFGYDFGSYATGYAYINSQTEYSFDSVVFCNDSIVGPYDDSSEFLIGIENIDFWGVTESFEHQYHIQSYFFGFSLRSSVKNVLDEFLFGRGMIYTDDKKLVIERFELSMTAYFQRHRIKPSVLFPVSKLMEKYFNNREDYLKIDEERFRAYFNIVSDHIGFNASHFLWRELYQIGFPFIKKELIRYNPTSYPYLHYLIRRTVKHKNLNKHLPLCF